MPKKTKAQLQQENETLKATAKTRERTTRDYLTSALARLDTVEELARTIKKDIHNTCCF